MTVATYTAAATLVLLNLAVTVFALRTVGYNPGQKLAQVLLVWLVPLFGVLIVWLALRQVAQENERQTQGPDHYADRGAVEGSYSQGSSFGGDSGGGDGD
jgi:hypothetical protein